MEKNKMRLHKRIIIYVYPLSSEEVNPPLDGWFEARTPDFPDKKGIGKSAEGAINNLYAEIPDRNLTPRESIVRTRKETLEICKSHILNELGRLLNPSNVLPFPPKKR